jgi:hypothetical protein
MSIGLLLVVVLVVLLLGGLAPWGAYPANHGYGLGPVVPGGLGVVLVILLVLLLLGRI